MRLTFRVCFHVAYVSFVQFSFCSFGFLIAKRAVSVSKSFSRVLTERRVRASVGKLNLKVAASYCLGRKQPSAVSLCDGVSTLRM